MTKSIDTDERNAEIITEYENLSGPKNDKYVDKTKLARKHGTSLRNLKRVLDAAGINYDKDNPEHAAKTKKEKKLELPPEPKVKPLPDVRASASNLRKAYAPH